MPQSQVTFYQDIVPIFEPYVPCMSNILITSPEGGEHLVLDNYEVVKRHHKAILARLRGVTESGQRVGIMPPSGPLPQEQVDRFAAWIDQGMQEGRAPVA